MIRVVLTTNESEIYVGHWRSDNSMLDKDIEEIMTDYCLTTNDINNIGYESK